MERQKARKKKWGGKGVWFGGPDRFVQKEKGGVEKKNLEQIFGGDPEVTRRLRSGEKKRRSREREMKKAVTSHKSHTGCPSIGLNHARKTGDALGKQLIDANKRRKKV